MILETLKQKVRLATILGTMQSTLTDFKYLRKVWKDNTEEERLLGVSLTGIMDHPVLSKNVDSKRWLEEMRQVAVDTNREFANMLGIPVSSAITCVKPSGTVSQLVDAAAGYMQDTTTTLSGQFAAITKTPLTQFLNQ